VPALSAQTGSLVGLLPPELCASCVGRAFARTEAAASNEDRGRGLRPDAPPVGPECPLCEGLPGRVEAYARLCIEAAAVYEWDTFLVGSVLYREIRKREDELYGQLSAQAPDHVRVAKEGEAAAPSFDLAEYLKAEINREVGKRVEASTGRRVDFQRPHITFQVDTRLDAVRLQVASAYVEGRYRKHDRSMPQTRWPCRSCQGLGCRRCDFKGKTYEESVEEWVARPFLQASGAAEEAFHGMGREDIDACMLGTGRPFVLELKSPKRRRLDWSALAPRVAKESGGRVEAFEVAGSDAAAPARFKAADPEKTYVARCTAQGPVPPEALTEALVALRGAELEQRTPERVAHRRADLVRRRRILDLKLLAHDGDRFELEIRAESGTYIKEFVSGDEGRTRPSLAARLAQPCRVTELDVVAVHWTPPSPAAGL